MRRTVRRLGTTTAALLAAATLVACGGDDSGDDSSDTSAFTDQSAAEIEKAAIEDMQGLESLRLSGSITQDGAETELDFASDTSGDCTGTLTREGGTAEFISVDSASYIKGDEAFWTASIGSAKAAQKVLDALGDKWAVLPAEAADFSEICDLDSILDEIESDGDDTEITKGDVTDVDGREAIELSKDDEDGGSTTAAIATSDDGHYFLEVTKEGGDEPGTFSLSDFDEPVDAEAPADDDVVDLNQLQG